MRILKDDFKPNQPISAVSFEWLNAVARFINKLTGARGIFVDRSGDFPKIELEDDMPKLTSTTPSDVGTAAFVGISTEAARADHVHAFPDVFSGDQTLSTMIDAPYDATNNWYDLGFYPPVFDKYGRFKGLSTTRVHLGYFLG